MSEPRPHDELLDLVAVYALGALPEAEAAQVRAHLATCAECRAEYDALRPVVDTLGYAAESDLSDADVARVKQRLLAQIAPAAKVTPLRRRSLPVWPAYLAAALALGIAVSEAVSNTGLRTELSAVRGQLAQENTALADLVGSDAQRFPIPGGTVVRRGDKVYLAVQQLPPPPPGHVYQVWTLARGATTVAPSVTFLPSEGVTVISVPRAGDAAAIAVSVEPAGGSRQPTTKPLFLRKLG
jgi:anti-sigma-K factor RskA